MLVVILVTGRAAAPGFAGLAIGLTLTVIHLVGIPLDGTPVNPARSLGPALFHGGTALSHVWLFVVAPLIGGVISGRGGAIAGGRDRDHAAGRAGNPACRRDRSRGAR